MPPVRRGPRAVSSTLGKPGSGLATLLTQAQRLAEREKPILARLPAQAQGHVRLARLDAERMTLVVDSPAWNHRVRYLAEDLRQAAEQHCGIRPARVVTRVGELPRAAPRPEPRALSPGAADTLRAAARSIDNPALVAALERLARRASDSDT